MFTARASGDDAEETVDGDDEQRDEQHAPQASIDTLGDVVSTQARADCALFSEVHRRSQTTGTLAAAPVPGFALAVQASDASGHPATGWSPG
jgi:hypothetical protein